MTAMGQTEFLAPKQLQHNNSESSDRSQAPSKRSSFKKRKNKNGNHMDNVDAADSGNERVSGVSDDPNLYRIFFRSPDKIRSLEEAQVFINHIKVHYGPLTQYQFSRCPETQRYFGYGFLTFKKEESLKKAISDGFIRVGSKDYEIKRTGMIPSRWTPTHKNTGFPGFYNLEELRAKKAEEQGKSKSVIEDTHSESPLSTIGTESDDVAAPSKPFESALSSSFSDNSPTASGSDIDTTKTDVETVEGDDSETSLSSKHSHAAPPKKSMAQLWKIIPRKITKSEATSTHDDNENSKESLVDQINTNSPKIDESIGNVVNSLE
ncbi:hypothetical protein BGZ80_001139 [Entomortierella chlamydospora]|uniref:RRM domain-containing protein n=1 Tax=Entomortierella chlamydospora TaxID=101097 RepID=A0A9P6SYI4_9FUNG|nr:hypothetical protein BGZ80_001139 [Entomortierella chlamydospora]